MEYTQGFNELLALAKKFLSNLEPCDMCKGTGLLYDDGCPKCGGTGKQIKSLGVLLCELPEDAKKAVKKARG